MSRQRFKWKAIDTNGIIRRGVWAAKDISEVHALLRKEGYFPVTIRARRNWQSLMFWPDKNLRWGHFARKMATLLEAGIPLLQALEIMTDHQGKLTTQLEQWKIIKDRVAEGSDLSEAMSLLNPPPNSFVLSMIRAGEYTGSLGKSLNELADELDQEDDFHKKIKAALAYPVLLVFALVVLLYVFSIWVLPMYEKLFISLGADLPFLTRVIFVCGRKLPFFLWGGFGLFNISLLVLRFTSSELWKTRLERLLSRLPLLRKIYLLRDLVQFSRIIECLLSAGIPLLEALRLTVSTLRSPKMQELTNQLVQCVRHGKRMAPLLRASRIFPKEGAEMIAVAEEAGQIEQTLKHVTKMFRLEFEGRLDQLTRMLEPLLVLIVAGLIGLVAAGVMLPIFDLSSHLE